MISLTISEAFVVLLIAHLAVVFAATLYYAIRQYRWVPRRHAAPVIFRCSVCGHVYLDRRNVPMSECGKCGNMNESIKGV